MLANLGSGAKLNTSKSEAMWLGRWRINGDSPFGLKCLKKMRIPLAAFFSNDLFRVDDDNWRVDLMPVRIFGVLHRANLDPQLTSSLK